MKKLTPSSAPVKKLLTESDLLAVQQQRARIAKLKAEAKAEGAILNQLEAEVVAAVKAGARVQGNLVPYIQVEAGKCSPKWKEEYLAHMAEHGIDPDALTAEVQGKYPGGPVETLVIDVKPGPQAVR